MKILIAEDEPVSRRLLEQALKRWGHEVQASTDGREAWERLSAPDAPGLAIIDWMMPGVDGLELCRRVRAIESGVPKYLMLLTARSLLHIK
jgi:CheY-like chemotaxis protein